MENVLLADAKIFYDQEGQAQEVLISYETYRWLEAIMHQLRESPEQGYFWSDGWQARIREGEADIEAGRTLRITADDIETALEWLDG